MRRKGQRDWVGKEIETFLSILNCQQFQYDAALIIIFCRSNFSAIIGSHMIFEIMIFDLVILMYNKIISIIAIFLGSFLFVDRSLVPRKI